MKTFRNLVNLLKYACGCFKCFDTLVKKLYFDSGTLLVTNKIWREKVLSIDRMWSAVWERFRTFHFLRLSCTEISFRLTCTCTTKIECIQRANIKFKAKISSKCNWIRGFVFFVIQWFSPLFSCALWMILFAAKCILKYCVVSKFMTRSQTKTTNCKLDSLYDWHTQQNRKNHCFGNTQNHNKIWCEISRTEMRTTNSKTKWK